MEQPKTEKPFMLQQLIFHGLLAGALLICGWLFPAKYKALHPKVLEQAGLASAASKNRESIDDNRTAPVEKIEGEPEADALKQFIEGKYRSSGDDSIRALLKLGDEKAKGTDTQTTTTYPSALSIFVNPANRVRYMDILSGFKEPEQNLYRLRELAPQYRSAAALVAYLDGRRKLHSDLRKDLLTYMANGQTNQVQRTMHAVITLGTRLSFEQMGEITGHTSSPEALIDFAKIAKIQTILYPFNSYDINPDKKIEANELKGLLSVKRRIFPNMPRMTNSLLRKNGKKSRQNNSHRLEQVKRRGRGNLKTLMFAATRFPVRNSKASIPLWLRQTYLRKLQEKISSFPEKSGLSLVSCLYT